MASKHEVVAPPPDLPMPIQLPKNATIEIQTQGRKLVVSKSKVPGTDAYYASLAYPEDQKESCIALCKRPSDAHEAFKVLTSCSSKNIAKPLGVWEVEAQNIAYIVFPSIAGALKSINRKCLFELEDESELSSSTAFFTDQGCTIFVDLIMAVRCVNELNERQLPVKPLKLETGSIFYQLKADGQYHVLLADFADKDKSHGAGGGNRRRNRGKDVKTVNWNGLSKFLKELGVNIKPNSELANLAALFGEDSVTFDGLVWESALWKIRTKLQFIREVFWCYDKNESRITMLQKRKSLGLQTCIDKLEANKSRGEYKEFDDKNLYSSIFFLRVYVVSHQDDTIKHSNQKVLGLVEDQRSILRLLAKEKADYMTNLIREIRSLKCIETSPLLRQGNDYMKEFYPTNAK
ncbi:unnamed protein product [Urochloa humidicola]